MHLVFLQETIKANEGITVTQIGYSLGGCLTEICYKICNGEIESYAFDSPGSVTSYSIDLTTVKPKAIHHYMAAPSAVNTCLQHLDSSPTTLFHKMSYPLKEQILATSLEEYLKMSLMLHAGMLLQDQSAITVVDVTRWPVGLQSGLAHFYSRANKDTWAVLLDKHWRNVCKKLDIDASDERNFDKFFDYFAQRYLDKEQGKWKYVIPFQNVGEYVQKVEKMPLYVKLFYTPLEIGLSIWASWKNCHPLDNLSSKYVQHVNKHQHKYASKGFIFDTVSAVFSTAVNTAVDVYSGIKIIGHLLWDQSFIPKTWVSSHNKVAAHHNNDNGKLADGGLIVRHQHPEKSSKNSQLQHYQIEEKECDAGRISADVVHVIGEQDYLQLHD
jgi:hypothetical protein